jgi:hypothetical protein
LNIQEHQAILSRTSGLLDVLAVASSTDSSSEASASQYYLPFNAKSVLASHYYSTPLINKYIYTQSEFSAAGQTQPD